MSSPSASKTIRASLWISASYGLGRILQFCSQVILARLLSPSEFGVWAMVLVLTNFSILFRDLAIAQVLVQRGIEDRKVVNTVYSLGINISIALFAVQALAGVPLAYFFRVPLLIPLTLVSASVFLIGAGAGSHTAVMQHQMKFRQLALCESLASLARIGGAVAAAFCGLGVWSFAIGEISMTAADAIAKRFASGYRFTYQFRLDAEAVKQVRSFIGGIVSANVAVQLNTNLDNIVIGRFFGVQVLGHYNFAYILAMTPAFLMSQVNRVLFSVMAKHSHSRLSSLCQVLEIYAVLSAPLYGIAAVTAPWLIPFVFGAEWQPAVPFFQITLVAAYARGIMGILGTTLIALGRPLANAKINWALVPIAACAYIFGAQQFGAVGVASMMALVMGAVALVWFWVAISRITDWTVIALIQPIAIPTFSIAISIGVAFLIGSTGHSFGLQSVALLLSYLVLISIGSAGRIPQRLITLARKC